ncbi:COX15/CtaA family protein [Maritalea porphyrae]|jgi:cytochrome c oxidase assembly protein subunit 15|uniref:COX15/CtaA family protein n=1 Tax=Maritalea porphyrae TaxID=880732 RepID=UPI0022AE6026|nr:COX15/CtaA family protein [Maritalea porphyrae]MCZ4270810.1 COX15/CtaA family protein [Maritalea porphyrae]
MSVSNQPISEQTYEAKIRPVRIWLYVLALLVLLMVMVGGATRLTDSGLSITQWKPISGTIPPLSLKDWNAEFDAYRQIPEYQQINKGMSLEEFKGIFWWEWGHRFLGRFIGLVFLVPFLVFLFQRRLDWKLAPALAVLFVMGGFQGFLGWWMVSSGLVERVDVSQYRLAAHLGAACILFVALIWVARQLRPAQVMWVQKGWRPLVVFFGLIVFVQIIAGAFVAGLDAGFSHNTWPLMDGKFIPNGLAMHHPIWINSFENIITVQFNHRMIAYLILALAVGLSWHAWAKTQFDGVHGWMLIIAGLTLLQVILGILTLIYVVPMHLGLAHQVTAFVLMGSVAAYLSDMSRQN